MCVAAYLAAFGVTFGAATVALTALRPLAIVFAVLALVLTLRRARAVGAHAP